MTADRAPTWRDRWAETFPGRCVRSLLEMQAVDRAMVIASQAFTALVPLLIVVSAAAPQGRGGPADAIVRRFALTGASADAVRQVFARTGTGSIGVVGVLLLVASAVALTRRMQHMYQLAWRVVPPPGVRASVDAALGLSALLLEIAVLSALQSVVGSLPYDWALGPAANLALGTLLWTTVPWLLLDRRLAWRRLLLGGLLTAACVTVYASLTTVYMPRLLERYSARYGLFGVTLAMVGWLLVVALVVVVSTVVAAEVDRLRRPSLPRRRAATVIPRGRADA